MRVSPFVLILAGFVVWSIAFLALYATQATGCRLGWDGIAIGPLSLLRLSLTGLFILAVALLAGLYRYGSIHGHGATGQAQILVKIAYMVHLAALISTVITFSGVFWLSLCR
jgi:hypothetical protein